MAAEIVLYCDASLIRVSVSGCIRLCCVEAELKAAYVITSSDKQIFKKWKRIYCHIMYLISSSWWVIFISVYWGNILVSITNLHNMTLTLTPEVTESRVHGYACFSFRREWRRHFLCVAFHCISFCITDTCRFLFVISIQGQDKSHLFITFNHSSSQCNVYKTWYMILVEQCYRLLFLKFETFCIMS